MSEIARYTIWWARSEHFRMVLACFTFGPASIIGAVELLLHGDWLNAVVAAGIFILAIAFFAEPWWSHSQMGRRSGDHRSHVMPWNK